MVPPAVVVWSKINDGVHPPESLWHSNISSSITLRSHDTLFASWVVPLANLMARVYAPTDHVLSLLNRMHQVALNLSTWHLTMAILAPPLSKGGLGKWDWACMCHAFVQSLVCPRWVAPVHMEHF